MLINKKISTSVLMVLLSTSVLAKPLVLTCEPEWAALTRTLAGDLVRVASATTYQQDPHHIQARPSLIAKARRAKLLVCTGAELEIGWLPLLLRKSGNGDIQVGQPANLMMAKEVSLLGKPQSLDRSQGDIHAAGNPHIHLDPNRIMSLAKVLSERLISIDYAHATDYQIKLTQFESKWQSKIALWKTNTKQLKAKKAVVYHDSWVYLLGWLGVQQIATLEAKAGVPPTSQHLSQLVAKLKRNRADFILYASYQDKTPSHWLAKKTGISVVAVDFSPYKNENLSDWFDRLINKLLDANQ